MQDRPETQDHLSIQERLNIIGSDDTVKEKLQELQPDLADKLPEILHNFYEHIVSFPALAELFRDENHIEMAKGAQNAHWNSILTGEYGPEYLNGIQRIGLAHHKLNLEPRWYVGGYAIIFQGLIDAVLSRANIGDETRRELSSSIRALALATMLDMELAISVYIDEGKKERTRMRETLASEFRENVTGTIEMLNVSVGDISKVAADIRAAMEQGCKNCEEVADAASSASGSVSAIAAAVEEMSQSVKEINHSSNNTDNLVKESLDRVRNADRTIASLSEAADKIGDFVSMISDIASQTNLLALNATIEAARAGEAGKGFAVVASEAKQLATQSARATEDITRQIAEIQEKTKHAVDAIAAIKTTIASINETSAAVAAATEEQTAVTNEIARNAELASSQTHEVSGQVGSILEASQNVSERSEFLDRTARDLEERNQQMREATEYFLQRMQAG